MPKIVDHDLYRKELLYKCFDLFVEKGYGSITMRQLAQGLGVSTGTLYHYFPSKEALFLQLVDEQTRQDIGNFLTEGSGAKTLTERIDAIINFMAKYEDYFFKQIILSCDFCQQQGRAEFLNNQILQQSWEQTREVIADYLQINDRAIADFILTFLHGLIVGRLYEGDRINVYEQGKLLKNMLIPYLQTI
jgi:AcrR family transcriptional regulator